MAGDVGRLGALAAWKMTQGIYRFAPSLYRALIDTPVTGDIPHNMLYRLPEWCEYLETPDMAWGNGALHGFFAHLEHDPNNGRAELRLLLNADEALQPVPLHLGAWSLAESVARAVDVANIHLLGLGLPRAGVEERVELRSWAEPLMSLLLYLCAENAEIGDGERRPMMPQPLLARAALEWSKQDSHHDPQRVAE